MKRIYITAVPLESNFRIESKPVNPVGFSLPNAPDQSAFPIVPIVASSAEPGDDVLVITVRQANEPHNSNLDILHEELASLQLQHLRFKDVTMPESQDRDVLLALFKRMIDAAETDACYYACMTFGTKTYPVVLFSVLSYICKVIPETELKGIYYQEIRRAEGQLKDAYLYNVTPLFLLNRVVDFAASADGNAAALISALLEG